MKKRLIISGILIIVIGISTLFINQRKAEAVFPFIGYVAISALIHFAVGAYVYFSNQSHKITAIDSSTGQLTFEFVDDTVTETSSGVPAHRVQDDNSPSTNGYNSADCRSAGQQCNASETQLQGFFDTAITALWSHPVGTHIEYMKVIYPYWAAGNCNPVGARACMMYENNLDEYTDDPIGGAMGDILLGDNADIYEFIEDVPLLPTCFDGIQNQDETGIDCGGVCEINFGFVCPPPPETCFDGIMNQDETGIDYGGVCGIGGDPPSPGPQPSSFVDANSDGIDDLSGYDDQGNVPIGLPAGADSNTYDAGLPGVVEDVGDTDWTGLITGYLSSNPLVVLATGNQINVSGDICSLSMNIFGKDMTIDFCSLEWMVELFGTFVLGLMAIRSVFIAMGI
ncbi:MAG: hypothetical protein ACE5GV_07850 [Candidatus Scalindua sp.]